MQLLVDFTSPRDPAVGILVIAWNHWGILIWYNFVCLWFTKIFDVVFIGLIKCLVSKTEERNCRNNCLTYLINIAFFVIVLSIHWIFANADELQVSQGIIRPVVIISVSSWNYSNIWILNFGSSSKTNVYLYHFICILWQIWYNFVDLWFSMRWLYLGPKGFCLVCHGGWLFRKQLSSALYSFLYLCDRFFLTSAHYW